MGQNEEGTLARIKSLRRDVIEPKVQEHHGRIFKTTGDGLSVEFRGSVEAVRGAVGLQEALAADATQKQRRTNSGGFSRSRGDMVRR